MRSERPSGSASGLLLYVLDEAPAVPTDLDDPAWAGWETIDWHRAEPRDGDAPILNLFTRRFLTEYVTFAARRALAARIELNHDDERGSVGLSVLAVDLVAVGSFRPEWIVVVRVEGGAGLDAPTFAEALNTLAKTHLPTYNRDRRLSLSVHGTAAELLMTPNELVGTLLDDCAPPPVAESFRHGVVDGRAKVVGFAAHTDAAVRSDDAVRNAVWLAGAVHSVSGMDIDGVLRDGHAVRTDLFNNWTSVCTLDGLGIVHDPDDAFAAVDFRAHVLDAYWLVYADVICDVSSVDRYLRRPILDVRRRRELLDELVEFGQLNRQWSARGTNAFPFALAIRRAAERIHDLDHRILLAQRRSDSISASVVAVANHRLNKVLVLVAVLTAGSVVQTFAAAQEWFAPFAPSALVALLATLVVLADPRRRTRLSALAGAAVGAAVGALLAWLDVLPLAIGAAPTVLLAGAALSLSAGLLSSVLRRT